MYPGDEEVMLRIFIVSRPTYTPESVILAAQDREDAKRKAHGILGGDKDRYVVTPITNKGEQTIVILPHGPRTLTSRVEEWKHLMDTYPRDGWDGAGEAIARHDAKVIDLERELDKYEPGWRDVVEFRPRTHLPR